MSQPSSQLASILSDAHDAGDMERVIALATQAMGANGEGESDEFIALLLGSAQQATGRLDQAAETFGALAHKRPEISAYWNNLAIVHRQLGDEHAAEQAFLTARSLAPNDAELIYNLGLLYMQQRRWLLARDTLINAVTHAPSFIEARLQAAYACHVCGDNTGQEALLAGAAHWPPQPAAQALTLAVMLSAQGDFPAALDVLTRAEGSSQDAMEGMQARFDARRVVLHERSNQLQLARLALQRLPLHALDQLSSSARQARAEGWAAHATMAMRDAAYDDAIELQQRALALVDDDESRAAAAFGLAAAYDQSGKPHEALQAVSIAHAAQWNIAREVVPELLAVDSQPLPMVEHVVSRHAYAGWSALPGPSREHSPVFVVGFPRSGTTLLEQMIDAHPDFRSMDERAFIHELTERMERVGQRYPEHLAALTATEADHLRAAYFNMVGRVLPDRGQHRLVDKNPLNMLCLPMIMRLFPNAPIVLCLRHPCDVLLSCYLQSFRSPAFMVLCSSLQRLAHGYVRAFEQWHRHVDVFAPPILKWRYESVVGDFDASVDRLGQFLAVADAAPMRRFAEHAANKRHISTPSYAQVTQSISPKAVNRWHAYRDAFEPVFPILRPIMDRLGYSD
jgi:Flp pilus assembly protein TadD